MPVFFFLLVKNNERELLLLERAQTTTLERGNALGTCPIFSLSLCVVCSSNLLAVGKRERKAIGRL